MTPTDRDTLHEWLLFFSGETAATMWHDLEILRKNWPPLPTSEAELIAGLEQLEAAGLARRDGEQWWYSRPAAKREKSLF